MELFENIVDSTRNLLPQDGTVNYYGKILNQKEANDFYKTLLEAIEWKNDEAVIFGKKIITKRKVAWYATKISNTPIRIPPKMHFRGRKNYWL